jgi:uncharacterized protein YdeI (YjbR/CyaY-like superfamily)
MKQIVEFHMKPVQSPPVAILTCRSAKEWSQWLARNHGKSDGVWLKFFKKTADGVAISRPEALDEALCYGWIDGQLKKHDDESWLQKFTPRRTKSIWSKINVGHATRLIESGRMKPAGLREVEAARQDGRWAAAYDSPSSSTMPKDFLEALSKNKKAEAFFQTLNKANRYSISWRLQTAKKPETRERRMKAILAMLAKGQAFHPQS